MNVVMLRLQVLKGSDVFFNCFLIERELLRILLILNINQYYTPTTINRSAAYPQQMAVCPVT